MCLPFGDSVTVPNSAGRNSASRETGAVAGVPVCVTVPAVVGVAAYAASAKKRAEITDIMEWGMRITS